MLLGRDHVLWLLESICRVHRTPFDANLVLQNYPPPYSELTLIEAGSALGFRIGAGDFRRVKPDKLPVPCIVFLRERSSVPVGDCPTAGAGPDTASLETASILPALLMRIDSERVLYFEACQNTPLMLPLSDFASCIEPEIMLVARAGAEVVDEDLAVKRQPFGFKWFVPELLKHKAIWRDVMVASFWIQILALATPLFTQVILDKIVVHHTRNTLWVVGIALVMFMMFSAVMTWFRQSLVLHTGNRVDAVLGESVFRHLFRLPMPYFEQRQTGVLVARLQGVEQIREFVAGAAVTLLLDCPFLVVFLAIMFWYSWQLSLIALGILGVIVVLSLAVSPLFRIKLNNQFLIGARNQAFVTEYLAGIATVKSLQLEPVLEARYGEQLAQYLAASYETKQLSNTYNVIANTLEQLMTVAILIAGALLVIDSAENAANGAATFTVGMLVAFQMFANRMSQPMLRLVGLWQQFQQASIAVKRLGDVMDMPTEPRTLVPQRPADASAQGGGIEFQNLSFRYSDKHPWLYRNLNLAIKPGQLTVLTGPSGCGKSTLVNLLQGFYPPGDGRILIDGQDVGQMGANELRAKLGTMPQETTLFSQTIYENLQDASPHVDFAQITEACRMAEIHTTIEQLPQGYQTRLGEHGVGLSGGQRQRIAIARALLKKPKVLIFDEPTSNLDPASAESFARTINQLRGKVTMVVIAHQLPKGLVVDEVVRFGGRGGGQ